MIISSTENFSQISLENAGGKGGSLLKLSYHGFQVPPFFIVTSRAFEEFVSLFKDAFQKAIQAIDPSSPSAISASSSRIGDLFCSQTLPNSMKEAISKQIETFGPNLFYAVRSSALGEDSANFSYAGMLDSFLFCRSLSEVFESVVKCWASLYSERAIAYRKAKGLKQDSLGMAVVIQKMIDGAVSGVTFTVNPTTKHSDEILINALSGLGEGLVSGGMDADQYIFLKSEGYTIEKKVIVSKKEKFVFDGQNGGTKIVPIPSSDANIPTLNEPLGKELAKICHSIEKEYKFPLDIEWTIDLSGKIYILQARPITTIDRVFPSPREHLTVWDNSNIVESYSGVTTPLTYSFARHAYHMVYVQFCQVLKVPDEVIKRNDSCYANMIGLLHGRVYYNLKNWYKLISVLPGYDYNRRFMEQMMGVKVKSQFDPNLEKETGIFKKYFQELPRLIRAGIHLAWKFLSIDSEVKKFMEIYQAMFDKYKDFDFSSAPAHTIIEIYDELENSVLRNWKAPIINDFMAMIFYGVLKQLIIAWDLDQTGNLQNDLVAGQGEVESTLPFRELQKIARFIKSKPELTDLFKSSSPGALRDKFASKPAGSHSDSEKEICTLISKYLEKYGYRSMNELKLETPSLLERPDYVFSILKNYLSNPLPEADDTGVREKEIRRKAEVLTSKRLKGQKIWGFIPKTWVFSFVVNYAKKAISTREFQRFARTKMYGIVRRMFLGIGNRLVEIGALKDVQDIFYLTQDEVVSFVVGASTCQNIQEIAEIRKKEFAKFASSPELPDRIETHGIVYASDLSKEMSLTPLYEDDPMTLRGTGCCSGIVKNKVKVILNPQDDMSLNGEILVAGRTDPGWVPLFPSASGLLVERGSMLSHSAIVAREIGLPAIVGIPQVTKRLKTGDFVEMDGSTGIIRIISQ